MTTQKVSAKELAEARDRGHNVSRKELSDAYEDFRDDAFVFCDSWIYSVMMQVIIIGSLIPLHIHLQKNNDYFCFVRFMMGMQVTSLLFEIGLGKKRSHGRAIGSISHMCGVVAIILHLRLISPALAMGVGIPLSLWVLITIFFQFLMLSA